ncbi:hypothetical protein L484_016877 [Morus notabilis]|uniref:Uncharacterized protein n=1 Tax=Morus notabilis TaxID=981085 RepID=W9RWC2_9ROSA|nr:hypothetical protein L484_016877 [Morus notabilis]
MADNLEEEQERTPSSYTLFLRVMSKGRTWVCIILLVYAIILTSSWNFLKSILSWYNLQSKSSSSTSRVARSLRVRASRSDVRGHVDGDVFGDDGAGDTGDVDRLCYGLGLLRLHVCVEGLRLLVDDLDGNSGAIEKGLGLIYHCKAGRAQELAQPRSSEHMSQLEMGISIAVFHRRRQEFGGGKEEEEEEE